MAGRVATGRTDPGRGEGVWTLEQKRQLESFLADVENRAFRIARYGLGDGDAALDVVQDTMFKLVRKYAHRSEEEWPALFYRILDNGIKDWHRRRIVRQKVVSLFGGSRQQQDDDPVALAPDLSDPGPEARVQADQALTRLEQALAQLPDRQRQAFLLRQIEGLDTRATAAAMGCSTGSVKTHYFRALQTLQASLGETW